MSITRGFNDAAFKALKKVGLDASVKSTNRSQWSCIAINIADILRGVTDPILVVSYPKSSSVNSDINLESLSKDLILNRSISSDNIVIILHFATNIPIKIEGLPWFLLKPDNFIKGVRRGGKEYIKDLLLTNVPLNRLNPYSSNQAVLNDRMFYGRHNEIVDLCSDSSNYFVVGPRRCGKTSLAYHLNTKLRGYPENCFHIRVKNKPNASDQLYSVTYVDLQRLTSLEDLWETLLRTMGLLQTHFLGGIQKKLELQTLRSPINKDTFHLLCDLIEQKFNHTVLLLDEVDSSITRDQENGWSMFSKLQALVDLKLGKVKVILFGYETLYHASRWPDFPLHGRGEIKRLANLGPKSVAELIQEPIEELGILFEDPEQSIHKIEKETGGQPNLIQDVCRTLVSLSEVQDNRRIHLRHVNDLVETKRPDLIARIRGTLRELNEPLPSIVAFIASDSREVRFAKTLSILRNTYKIDVNIKLLEAAFIKLFLLNVFHEIVPGRTYSFSSTLLQDQLNDEKKDESFNDLFNVYIDEAKGIFGELK